MLLFYCLTVRQYITEKRAKRLRELNPNLAKGNQNDSNLFINADMQSQISGLFYSILVKYWIFLSSATLLLMSCQNEVVAYRIGYMCLFLYFITTFQVELYARWIYTGWNHFKIHLNKTDNLSLKFDEIGLFYSAIFFQL